jgi:hypothetical protein
VLVVEVLVVDVLVVEVLGAVVVVVSGTLDVVDVVVAAAAGSAGTRTASSPAIAMNTAAIDRRVPPDRTWVRFARSFILLRLVPPFGLSDAHR